MIPGPHRTKGGAPLVGALPGQVGPFGPYGTDSDDDADDRAQDVPGEGRED